MAAQVSAYREFAEQSNMKTTSSAVLAARQAVEAAIDATPHDYKTGNFLPSQDKMDDDRQLALYSIAIKEIYGKDKEVCLIWHYLAHNQKICSKRTNEQLEELKQKTLNTIKEIESTEIFPTFKSTLCHWCEYKSICPEWKEQKKIDNMQENKLDIWD